jgi:hypothetical protein
MTVRSGTAEWHGNVQSGSGTVTVGDGVFEGAYSYDSRFGEGKGTNPEQLIAAAHAACFTMALSDILSAAGHPPESLRTDARVQLRNIDGAPRWPASPWIRRDASRESLSGCSRCTRRRPSGCARCRARWPGSPRSS